MFREPSFLTSILMENLNKNLFSSLDPNDISIGISKVKNSMFSQSFVVTTVIAKLGINTSCDRFYTDFRQLYDAVGNKFKHLVLPEFPTKSAIHKLLFKEDRRTYFDSFLNYILQKSLKHPEISNSLMGILYNFLFDTKRNSSKKLPTLVTV